MGYNVAIHLLNVRSLSLNLDLSHVKCHYVALRMGRELDEILELWLYIVPLLQESILVIL